MLTDFALAGCAGASTQEISAGKVPAAQVIECSMKAEVGLAHISSLSTSSYRKIR